MARPTPITWLRGHPRTADGLLAVLVTVIALVAHLSGADSVDDPNLVDPTWWTVALVLAATVPLAWRRVRPLHTGVFVVSAEVVALFIGVTGAPFLAAMVAVYSIGAHTSGRTRTRTMSAIAVLVVALFVAGWIDGLRLIDEFVATGITLITAFVVGDNLRRRRQQVADLAERAERAEREQLLLAERRVGAERARIARELHDVVAHSVSVMVIQAAAARRTLDTSPADAETALRAIETTGRQTMTELRAILGVLRSEDEPTGRAPQPALDQLTRLADDDLPVTVDTIGDLSTIPDSTATVAYRIVQEALTNVRRHAGPVSAVAVSLERGDDTLRISIADDGRGAAAEPSTGGYGLVGMRERVGALGGNVVAGPRRGGGWEVTASLPTPRDRPSETSAERLADRAGAS